MKRPTDDEQQYREWKEAAEILRAVRAIKPHQSAPELNLSSGPKVEREMKLPETVAPESMRKAECGCPLCVHTRKKEAREPAATHLTADRLALVGVILSMLRDKLPSNAVRIAVEIEFADGGECKMDSKA